MHWPVVPHSCGLYLIGSNFFPRWRFTHGKLIESAILPLFTSTARTGWRWKMSQSATQRARARKWIDEAVQCDNFLQLIHSAHLARSTVKRDYLMMGKILHYTYGVQKKGLYIPHKRALVKPLSNSLVTSSFTFNSHSTILSLRSIRDGILRLRFTHQVQYKHIWLPYIFNNVFFSSFTFCTTTSSLFVHQMRKFRISRDFTRKKTRFAKRDFNGKLNGG